MVTVKTIETIINKIIKNRIIIKHAPHISWTELKNVLTNKEDYETIQEKIKYFHKEKVNRNKKNTESLVGWADKESKNIYENWDGKEYTVKIPKKMREKGLTEGLFFMCHSHINYTSCFQSIEDFESILKYNIQYSFTMAKDGFMLVINNNKHTLNSEDYNGHVGKMEKAQMQTKTFKDVTDAYNNFSKAMSDKFYEEYVPKLNDKQLNELIKDYDKSKIDKDTYLKKISKPYHEFYSSTLPKSANDLNKIIKEYNMEVYYFPKTT